MVDITKYGAQPVEDTSTASLASGASASFRKFAQDVVREDYANPLAPDALEASKQADQEEWQSLHSALPDAYDDSAPYGDSATDFFIRADIARSRSLEDKTAKFRKAFPDAQIRMESIKGKNYLLARNNSGERWKRVDSFGADVAAGGFSAATALGIAGEVAGAATVPYVGAPLGAFGGYLAGTALDKMIEKQRGYSKDESLAPEAQDYFTAALGSAISIGGKLFEGTLKKGAKVMAGIEDAPQAPLVGKAIDFAEKEGLPLPTAGSTALSGTYQGMYAQAVRVDPATQLEAMRRPMAARESLLNQAERRGFEGVDPKVLQDILDAERTEINRLLKATGAREIEFNEASDTLNGLFQNWEKAVDGHFTLRYKKFFDDYGDDMSFNLSPAQSKALELRDGIVQKGVDKEVTKETGLVDATGKPITRKEMEVGGPVKTSFEPDGRLGSLMKRLLDLDPNMNMYTAPGGQTYTALESLKQLRSDFGKLTQSQDPLERHYAGQMYSAINDVFDRAIVNVSDPTLNAKAVAEWKQLSKDWKGKLSLEEITPIARMDRMDATQYADWSKSLMRPGKYEALKFLSDTLGTDGQQTVKDMFFTKVIAGERSPKGWADTVRSTFKQFTDVNDTKTLDFLMTPKDRKILTEWADARDKVESGLVAKLYAQDAGNAATAIDFATTGDARALQNAITLGGGIDSKFGQSVQAGFMQHLINTSSREEHLYGQILNTGELAKQVAALKERGTFDIIFPSKEAQEWFDGFLAYHNVTGMLPSQAAGLQTGEMAGKALKGGIVVAENVATGKPGKALERVWEIGTMGVPHKLLGRWFSREATKQGEKEVVPGWKMKGAKLATGAANSIASVRRSAQFMNYIIGQQKADDLQQYDADTVNQQYNAGGM